MTTYKHSGTAGDTIYSLAAVKAMGGGDFLIAIGNLAHELELRGYHSQHIDPAHAGRYTVKDFEMLAPLIQRQPYINSVVSWYPDNAAADIDLDKYRDVLYRTFEGNIVEAYFRTLDLPFDDKLQSMTWLEADAERVAPIVVNVTPRYRTQPSSDANFKAMAVDAALDKNAVFVGTPKEHQDFVELTGVAIPYRPVKDYLEMANIIAGADLFLGNQSLAYSIAVGLGKDCVLDIHKLKPQYLSECYFNRSNIQYI